MTRPTCTPRRASNRHRSRRRPGPGRHQRPIRRRPCSRRRGSMPQGPRRESGSTAWSCVLAALFLSLSLWYFLKTRWYLFPLLYLNFAYFGHRFVYVQDDTYLAMLVVVVIALVVPRPFEARRQPRPDGARHHDEALARGVRAPDPGHAAPHGDDLCRHPVRRFRAPVFHLGELPVHLHVPRGEQGQHLRHDRGGRARRALHDCALVRRDAARVRQGGSDRVVARAVRDVPRHQDAGRAPPADRAAGAGQAGPAQHRGRHRPRALRRGPDVFKLGSVLYITTVLLFAVLAHYLWRIGWATVLDDARHPLRTVRLLLSETRLP